MGRRSKERPYYAIVRRRYSTRALQLMGFRFDAQGRFVKRFCGTLLAEATSLDGASWRVRPLARHWR